MNEKLLKATTLKEKKGVIDQAANRSMAQQETEAFYKHIHGSGDIAFELLEYALERGVGQIVPERQSYGAFNQKQFENIIDSVGELYLIGLYCNMFQTFTSYGKTEAQARAIKILGYRAERLISEFRKQGTIKKKLQLEDDKTQFQDRKLQMVITMIVTLCPKDLSFNPELFQLMLTPFKFPITITKSNVEILEKLANVILQQCQGEGSISQNTVHDWLCLLTGIFQQANGGQSIGLYILLSKLSPEHIASLLQQHERYLLYDFFNDSNNSINIFQGLTKYAITDKNLMIISKISQILVTHTEKHKQEVSFQILHRIYEDFILTTVLGNIQMIDLRDQILELLEYYIIGMSSTNPTLSEASIELMCKRLKLVLNLSFSYDIAKPYLEFLDRILQYCPVMKSNQQFCELLKFTQSKSKGVSYVSEPKFKPWSIPNKLNQDKMVDPQLLEKEPEDYVGLENLTNTCFMNSFLQSLFMFVEFRKMILELSYTKELKKTAQYTNKQAMLMALMKLFTLLTYQKQGFCSPYELKRELRSPYSDTCDQQDVSEFAHQFLEDLHTLLPKNAQFLMTKLFKGTQRNVLKCASCPPQKAVNQRPTEEFLGLDLHFNKTRSQINQDDVNLQDMLRILLEPECLEFKCDQCGKSSPMNSKRLELLNLPPMLMMTIHRFTYDQSTHQMTKMLTKIPFEFELDMRQVLKMPNLDQRNSRYRLYAFINHLGKNSNSGHYTCYARHLKRGQDQPWINFDDTFIQTQHWGEQDFQRELVDEETPYLLFYQNESMEPLHVQN